MQGVCALVESVVSSAVHPNALHTANTNELNAYIITAIALIGKVYEFSRGFSERRAMAGNSANIFGIHRIVQAIGTQQEHIARGKLIFARIDAQEHVVAKRTAEHVRHGPARFACRDGAQSKLLAREGMIARNRRRIALAHQITARVARVRHNRMFVTVRASH